MIVLDASAAVDLFLGLEPRASALERILGRPGETLHAPVLFDAEVLHTLRRYSLRRLLTEAAARRALDDLESMRLARYPYRPLIDRMWQLRANLSAYDAAYVALAEALAAPLVTSDARLARTPGLRIRVELLS